MASQLETSKSNSAYENAVHTWAQIDLSNVQKRLDEQGIELRREQKESLSNRRDLAQKTKDFKKLDDELKLLEFNQLLKLYQNEIDTLTTKQKKAESYFFGFYRVIAEAPDPKPLLQLSLKKINDHMKNEELTNEILRLKDELIKRADYDLLKQRLLSNEQGTAELIAARLKQQEDMFKALIDEKESNWASVKNQHQNQLNMLKSTIEELKTSNEVAELQLYSHHQQTDHSAPSTASALVEVDLLTREVETWKKRVFELEKRNETLRTDLTASKIDSKESTSRGDLSKRLSELESENVILLASLSQARESIKSLAREKENKASLDSDELQQRIREINFLSEKLRSMDDYEENKQELYLMRQIEFGEGEANEDKNLDSLLLKRNKALTKELSEHRSEHEDLVNKIQSLEKTLHIVSTKLEDAQAFNAKLESDLTNVQDVHNVNFNDTASIMSVKTHGTRQVGREGSIGGAQNLDDASILPIITKQRDRFREKNKSLEDDLRKQQSTINDLRRKNSQLQTDNEDLYEKTRYVASLRGKDYKSMSRDSSYQRENGRKLLNPKSNVRNLENPYHISYESKLHPIEQFRQKEQERVNSRLSPVERLFIFVTRSVLATRTTRILFLVYCVCLHCIVMFTTIHSMSLSARMIPEVGLSHSTGGVADANGGKIIQDASF
ncbi:hypothetical protein METBIDRAFT_43761 [Metschnikowia bicuspidata var. bicuspidata NRRL YB-4993]|uniref:Protein CASP n=1 Tax=Metschnikowia bicuspidata var. bicuspidata NRRL YB-4993 TaxID=869754 RepID=A0A1A0H946_9ASCO|nr:hypothetical protein METBIDRAFT_43761 [Metschnikowia bicuspidata var. bicuspidata NRRL YB-4993]OBA20531.1 hypothetical protein METBIDRAFT_43761 [Metschnikowia bicuspidata var. bicuspidata NRRL YB-4993]